MDGDPNDPNGSGEAVPPSPPEQPEQPEQPAGATPPGFVPPSFTPPSFEAPPSFGAAGSGAAAPGGSAPGAADPYLPPLGPPGLPAAAPSSAGSNWRALIAPSQPIDTPRPAPTLTSMVAVGGGLLAAAGLFAILGELDGYAQRTTGLLITFLFVALGVAISVLTRSSRAAAGGAALAIIAVVPFTLFVFANANLFDLFSGQSTDADPWNGIRWTVTLMLAMAALLWLAGYLFVPTRRFGAFLGAALLAIWLIPIFNLQLDAAEDTLSFFSTSSTFESIPSDPNFDSGFDSGFDSDFDSGFDEFDSEFDDPSFEDQFGPFDEDVAQFEEPEISDPSTKIGLVSLLFGAVYLGFAERRDRRGDARMATAALVPAIIALYTGTSALSSHIGWFGRGLLAIVVGGAVLAIGVRGGRRASSWVGVFLATVGLGSMVAEPLGDSSRATGAALTVLGVLIVLVVGRRAALPQDPPPSGGLPPATEPPATGPPATAAAPSAAYPTMPAVPPAPEPPAPWSQSF